MTGSAKSFDTLTLLQKDRTCYIRLMGRMHQVVILGVEDKAIWVSFHGEHYPVEGLGVDLEFHHDMGYVSYHTRVIRGAAAPGDGLLLERSESIEERKHRQSWRVPTDIVVAIRVADTPRPFSARMANLSTGGMAIHTYAKLPLHADVDVQFDLPNQAGLALRGRVVHGKEGTALTSNPHQQYGIKFGNLSKDVSRALTYYLWGRIRESKQQAVQSLYPRSKVRRLSDPPS